MELVTRGCAALGCDGICLHLLSAERDSILLQVVSSGYMAGPTTQCMPLDTCPAVRACIGRGDTIVVPDALEDERVADRAIERFKIRACVYVPLRVGDQREGIVIASFRTAHPWSSAEVAAVRKLARGAEAMLAIRDEALVRSSG